MDATSVIHASGGGRLTAFTCCDGEGRTITPCGRCRQLLLEHGGPELLIDAPSGIRPLAELLPESFTPARLADRIPAHADPRHPQP